LGQFVAARGYSPFFVDNYLVPICSSIWSTPGAAILACDALTLLSFLKNHHMLQLAGRPQWITPARRSAAYTSAVAAALVALGAEVRTGCAVARVTRGGGGARPSLALAGEAGAAPPLEFDSILLAVHAPEALALLGETASVAERETLGAFGYSTSTVYLHRDATLMPRRRAAWAAWNFLEAATGGGGRGGVCLTYWLNKLQNLGDVPFAAAGGGGGAPPPVLVTLNPAQPPAHVVRQWQAAHPVPSRAAAAAKRRLPQLQGAGGGGLYFAGAYAGYGFHEDGVVSGLQAAAAALRAPPPNLLPLARPLRLAPSERLARASCAAFLHSFVQVGQLVVIESGGEARAFGSVAPPPPGPPPPPSPFGNCEHAPSLRASITVLKPAFYWKLAARADLGLADAYVDGDITVQPSLMALLCLAIANRDAAAAAGAAEAAARAGKGRGKRLAAAGALASSALSRFGGMASAVVGLTAAHWKHLARSNTVQQARRNISAHYDLSNDMFATFLSADMTYSCAIFDSATPDEPLQCAQERKLRALAERARLSPGMHVLEIGFGWGSLSLLLAGHYGVRVTGITLSQQQLELASTRVAAAGLSHLITFVLEDYRVHSPAAAYDRIVSCEMLEAVGHEYLPAYFANCARLLAPSGLLVVQVITTPEYRYEAYRSSTDFIKEYIFPGCCCPSLTACAAAAGEAALTLDSVTDIGPHYAPTLLRWRQAFMAARPRLAALGFSDSFVRCWDYYFQYCAAGFATRTLGDLQLVFSRAGNVASLGNVPFREEPRGAPPPLWWSERR